MTPYHDLLVINEIDQLNVVNENLFITGTVKKTRPDDSPKTPKHIADRMVNKLSFGLGAMGDLDVPSFKIFEPCAGRGGILELLPKDHSVIFFNEKDDVKKQLLQISFPKFNAVDFVDSLSTDGVMNKHKYYDKIIMNPPFDNAVNFLLMAMNGWLKEKGEIVSLFPKYGLARLKSNATLWLSMLSFGHVSIEDVDFGCGYNCDVSLIHLKR